MQRLRYFLTVVAVAGALATMQNRKALSLDENNLLVNCGDESVDSIDALQYLIAAGVDVTVLTEGGESALHLACIWDHPRKISLLMTAGADPNFRSSFTRASLDMTPITWCVYGNREDSVKEILKNPLVKVNLVVRREDGSFITALDIAKKIGNDAIADILIQHGARTYEELKVDYEHDAAALAKLLPPAIEPTRKSAAVVDDKDGADEGSDDIEF